jgi:hypothetical protein
VFSYRIDAVDPSGATLYTISVKVQK